MDREKLLARMTVLVTTADAQNRNLNDEELAEYNSLKAKVDLLDTQESPASVNARRRAEVQAARDPAPTHIAGTPARYFETHQSEWENVGEFLYAALQNPRDNRLTKLWRDPSPKSEQRMDTGSLGGFMIPEQFRAEIFSVPVQGAFVRPRATVIPAGSPPDAAISFPYLDQSENNFGGLSIGWVDGEGGTKPSTSGALGMQRLQPNEWAGVLTLTDKLLRNAPAAATFFTTELRRAATAFEDYHFLRGSGAGQPLGILSADCTGIVARATNNTFLFNDYAEMIARLLPGGSPVWSIALGLRNAVIKMRNPTGDGGDGSLIWAPSTAPGQPETLGGFPIHWNTRAPAVGSKGDVLLADLSYYLIKDGSGPFVASDGGIVNFTNNKTLIKVFGNVDGGPRLKELFTTESGYKVSPFIALSANGGATNF